VGIKPVEARIVPAIIEHITAPAEDVVPSLHCAHAQRYIEIRQSNAYSYNAICCVVMAYKGLHKIDAHN
jgi:hypothetical protein